MIAYTTIGTNDFEKSKAFYGEVLAELGAKPAWSTDGFAGFSTGEKSPTFAVCKPHDGKAATNGNGTMIALGAGTKDKVDATYAKALELGATDEGTPGPRPSEGGPFYMAYFRDADGNKIALFAPNK